MDELLQEFVDSRGPSLRVDRERGILRGVKLLGLESRNGRRYLPAALRQAAALYEGAKVNINHPKGHPLSARDYQDRIGMIHGVEWREATGLYGDLHFNPKHQLAEQLLWDAEHAPQNVGLSHNVQARTARQGDELVVEAILKVQSVDLVADPATTRGLFESTANEMAAEPVTRSVEWNEITLEQLEEHRPDLLSAAQQASAAQQRCVQEELDRLRVTHTLQLRRGRALQLLQEYKLPGPDSADPLAQTIVSPGWFGSLLEAPSDDVMRELVAERAQLVSTLGRHAGSVPLSRPMSREQRTTPAVAEPLDAGSFARLLR